MILYKRIILTGTLTTLAPLHIGTGDEITLKDENDDSDKSISYNSLCLDANNKPYIPASSLRGYLRSILSQYQDDETINKLFGLARQKSDSKDTGNIGLLRIYDALWGGSQTIGGNSQADYQQQLVSQTSIDPLTATAKEHHLSTHALVDSNSIFKLTIELDNVNQQQLILILKALNTLGQEYGGKLGKAKTSGQGSIAWEHKTLKILTQEKFIEWLGFKNDRLLSEFYQNHPDVPEINALVEAKTQPYINKDSKQLTLALTVQSPILINDPQARDDVAEQREKKNKEIEKDEARNSADLLFVPDLLFTQSNKQAIIPGSSLKGWVRARCRKILLTLMKNADSTQEKNIDTIVDALFGSTEQQGLIEFNHATVSFTDNEIHQQTFTAIDRFTGGVKNGALYQAESIWPENPFTVKIRYQETQLKGWMKLLLLFVIRDATEGDLILGWGKGKGYGRLILSSPQYPDWQSLYKTLDTDELQNWQKDLNDKLDLHQEIQKEAQEANA